MRPTLLCLGVFFTRSMRSMSMLFWKMTFSHFIVSHIHLLNVTCHSAEHRTWKWWEIGQERFGGDLEIRDTLEVRALWRPPWWPWWEAMVGLARSPQKKTKVIGRRNGKPDIWSPSFVFCHSDQGWPSHTFDWLEWQIQNTMIRWNCPREITFRRLGKRFQLSLVQVSSVTFPLLVVYSLHQFTVISVSLC